jgi:hypothetical protein
VGDNRREKAEGRGACALPTPPFLFQTKGSVK